MKKRFLEVQNIYKPSYWDCEDKTAFAGERLQNTKGILLRENEMRVFR